MATTRPKALSIDGRILARIRGKGRGAVHVPADFLDLGSRQAVDLTLHRLTHKGTIRRLTRGVYDYPREHPVLGLLYPSVEEIARALGRHGRARIQPAGAYAANALGLSEQVPAQVVFLTDGTSRTVQVGPLTIRLRRTSARNMATAGRLSGLLIQALRELGADNITAARIEHLRRTLPAAERRGLLRDLALAPAWMHPLFRQLAEEGA